MMTNLPISEEELPAYLDGELPNARRAAVEDYVREHPDTARRLEAYRADSAAIARMFSRVHPAPVQRQSSVAAPRRRFSAVPWGQLAAAVLILVAGAAAGWLGRDRLDNANMDRLAHHAAAAHLILEGPGVRPLATASLDELSRTMSSALGVPVALRDPSSTGYRIVGARLVPQANGHAVQLVMRGTAGEVITFYFEGKPGATETPFRVASGQGLTTLVWEDDNLVCAISSTLAPKKLEEVGKRIYEALLG
jgi:anti-sigma factor RsiW